jgi:predicted phosphodiesterase
VLGLDTSNPYGLPPSDPEPWEPFALPAGKRIAVMSDIHFPYHDIPAITAFVRYVEGADILLLNGDIFDMHGRSSKFIRDPGKRNIASEIEVGCLGIKSIMQGLGCSNVVFKSGNHDDGMRNYIWRNAPELYGLTDILLENIVRERVDITSWVEDKRKIKANALNILHGHEFAEGVSSPVNVAKRLYDRTKANAMCGHHHTPSYHPVRTIDGAIISCWSNGCFCWLHPQYMPINSWVHGGSIVTTNPDGKNFDVDLVRIKDGRVL